jgi:hypothetical protein
VWRKEAGKVERRKQPPAFRPFLGDRDYSSVLKQERNRDSSVRYSHGLDGQGSIPYTSKRLFSTPHCPDRLWNPTQSPIQWVPGDISLGVKRLGREADNSPPSSTVVKNDVAIPLLQHTSSWPGA